MITMMVSGTIARQPEQRTSRNGNTFGVATVRAQTTEGDLYASVTAFGSLADTLVGLTKGDPVTIIGHGKVSTYQGKDGDTKAGLSITASRIIAMTDHQAEPRQRSARSQPAQYSRRTEATYSAAPPSPAPMQADAFTPASNEFADEIPF